MTTKQPPAQKHLEDAKEALFKMFDIETVSTFRTLEQHRDYMVGILSSALSETEAAALAARIVGPTAFEVSEAAKKACSDRRDQYTWCEGAMWYRSQQKLTHENVPTTTTKEFETCSKTPYVRKAEENYTHKTTSKVVESGVDWRNFVYNAEARKEMDKLIAKGLGRPKESAPEIRVPKQAFVKPAHIWREDILPNFLNALKRLNPTAKIVEVENG